MDLDKTLKTVCWDVLRCPLFITEARVKRGKHYLVRRREACIGQERSNDNNQDKAGKMSLFSRKRFNVLDHIMHPRYGWWWWHHLLLAACWVLLISHGGGHYRDIEAESRLQQTRTNTNQSTAENNPLAEIQGQSYICCTFHHQGLQSSVHFSHVH